MFKTMDDTTVYDKNDIDQTLGVPEEGATGTAFERIAGAEANIASINEALTQKVNNSEIDSLVQTEVNDIIGTKVNEIANTFEDTIDGKVSTAVASGINTALAGYDDSNAVDTKISTAIGNIPTAPSAMTTSEATELINTYF